MRGSLRTIAEAGAGRAGLSASDRPGLRMRRDGGGDAEAGAARPRCHCAATPDGQRKLQHESGHRARRFCPIWDCKIRLLTNHPRKIVGLEGFGIEIVEQVPVILNRREHLCRVWRYN